MQYIYNKPKRGDGSDDQDELKFPFLETEKKPYKQYEQTYTAQHIHYYISKGIGEPEAYADMIHRIATASPSDVIFIHLNTPGGQIDTGVQLINAMQNSQAKVVTILEGVAYSLGTLIFLSGDEMIVNDNCMMMFHNFNGGLIGKGNELVAELDATVKWFETLARRIYIPFLTEDEYARITRGEDMWMQSPEIKMRMEGVIKEMQAKADKEAREDAALTEKIERLLAAELAAEQQGELKSPVSSEIEKSKPKVTVRRKRDPSKTS